MVSAAQEALPPPPRKQECEAYQFSVGNPIVDIIAPAKKEFCPDHGHAKNTQLMAVIWHLGRYGTPAAQVQCALLLEMMPTPKSLDKQVEAFNVTRAKNKKTWILKLLFPRRSLLLRLLPHMRDFFAHMGGKPL